MKQILAAIILILLSFADIEASDQKLYQMPGIHVVPIQDTQSNKQYELLVKLPENYAEDKDKNYPVIYFTDAIWHIELLSAATAFIMEDVILVGISWQKDITEDLKQEYGAHFSRFGDYSFKKLSNPEHPKINFGQANNHLAFIRKDVFKFVEENYRTEPHNRTYFGFSAGGNFGAYILVAQPDTFKNYILGSPSLYSDVPDFFAQENAALKSKESAINIFISYGELEKRLVPHVEEFISTLKNEKYKGVSSIKNIVIESSGHSDSFPPMGVLSVKWLSGLLTKEDKSVGQDDIQILEGPYLGQKPPGLAPEVFAPGIVSTEYRDWSGSFTPDMKEYYFTRLNSKANKSSKVVFKSENNQWHESELEPLVGGFISPDGKTMHVGKQYRERTDDGWSELKSLGSPFEDIGIMTLTVSAKGTYVFDERGTNGNGVLRYSRLIDGIREAPKPLSKKINTGIWTAHPYIAPDESYIIWDSENDGGYGGVDLYISFKQQDGSWGAAINFGDKINTAGPDSGGYVTPDGKYFLFNRKISPEDSDTYWVDAQVIETLRPNINPIK